jgi:hypothetical protein
MKRNSEEFNQIYVVSFLKKLQLSGLDFEFWHTANGGSRNKAEAGTLKMMGVLAGVPDLCLIGLDRNLHFIEFKKPLGKLSPEQKSFIEKSERYGFACSVVYADNPAEAIAAVSQIMVEMFNADQKGMSSISAKVLSGLSITGAEEKS